MFDFNIFNEDINDEDRREDYPDFFFRWDSAVRNNQSPGYYEPDDLTEIIDIYLSQGENAKADNAIEYAFKLHPENEDLVYDILLLLNDFELWNDLLDLCNRFDYMNQVWTDGHKLTALLHLGMEEDAFLLFGKAKGKYASDRHSLNILYQAMGEALIEVDLCEASIEVIDEAIARFGEEIDLLWLLIQGNLYMKDEQEEVKRLALKVETISPLDKEVWLRLGDIYREINDTEKTIEAYEYALSLGSREIRIYYHLMTAYDKNGNYNKALDKADEILKKDSAQYLTLITAANICSKIEDWERGIRYIEQAIKIAESKDTLYVYLSDFFLKAGEPAKAIQTLELAIKTTGDKEGRIQKRLAEIKGQSTE